jgi:hypothetical protein
MLPFRSSEPSSGHTFVQQLRHPRRGILNDGDVGPHVFRLRFPADNFNNLRCIGLDAVSL